MKIACIFAGQGAQKVGMCKNYYENYQVAKEVFAEVDEALKQNLSTIIFEGPEDELTLTENAQPALMACGIAMLKVLEARLNKNLADFCSYLSGHSLGEFTALAAAGAISISDCARLLKVRGRAMQEACAPGEGAMFALLGANINVAKAIAAEASCEVANDNAPEQQVLSGSAESIAFAIKLASEKGYKAVRLNVSAPFHSKLMLPAQVALKAALEDIKISPARIPIVANISADLLAFENTKDNLVSQVTSMVRWCESIKKLQELGVTKIVEIGPGKIYTNLNKRIDASIEAISSEDLLNSGVEIL